MGLFPREETFQSWGGEPLHGFKGERKKDTTFNVNTLRDTKRHFWGDVSVTTNCRVILISLGWTENLNTHARTSSISPSTALCAATCQGSSGRPAAAHAAEQHQGAGQAGGTPQASKLFSPLIQNVQRPDLATLQGLRSRKAARPFESTSQRISAPMGSQSQPTTRPASLTFRLGMCQNW